MMLLRQFSLANPMRTCARSRLSYPMIPQVKSTPKSSPNASVAQGVAEDICKNLKPDTIIQFERFGFVRVDTNNEKLTAYFTQK